MKIAFAALIVIHGLIHLLGFVKAFQLADVRQLTQPISRPAGLLWLAAAILFLLSAGFLLLRIEGWWIVVLTALLVSQFLIIQSWTDAKFGSIANVIILVPAIVALMNALPSSYQNRYRVEVQKRLTPVSDTRTVTEEDLRHLPESVQKYLRYTGAVGRPVVQNFRAVFGGSIRGSKDARWMEMEAQQYNFYDDPARLFYIESSMFGIPFDGLHLYVGDSATMQIKVASLAQVVDARGEKMTRSETVTLFNDMCLLAPATLISKAIDWEDVDSLTVRAKFTNKGTTIAATLLFNERGELTNFISSDRYHSPDGKVYSSYGWSTPVRNYKDFGGRRVTGYAEAIWHAPEGEYTYAKFNVAQIEYNCRQFR